jgi:serine/threonine protein kinase/Tfp pilus assembly protein PilF
MLLGMSLDQAPSDRGAPPPQLSLAERLKLRFGDAVDPRIELPPTLHAGSSSGSNVSPAVLRRLQARGPLSSRYRLEGELARGGMGAILEVFDEDLRRKLAMKVVLDADGAALSDTDRPPSPVSAAKLARFLEEAQVTGQLDHPGIVPVHELGVDPHGQAYFTMRLVRGRDLGEIFRLVERDAEGWNLTRAINVLLKVCEAMAFAHSKGVVHRDLKPANIMVGQFGEVYVMDWGLARVRGASDRHDVRVRREPTSTAAKIVRVATDRRDASSEHGSDALRTMDGDVLGTPSYMPPEQARGQLESIDERSDLYAVGAMLYRLLAGRAPYTDPGEEAAALTVLTRILEGPPKPVEACSPEASPELTAICEKAMARERGERYADVLALAEDLRAWLEGRVVEAFETGAWAQARKWVLRNRALSAAAAAALVALVAGAGVSLWFGARAASNAVLAEERRVAAERSATSAARQARIADEVNAFLNDDLLASIAPEHEGAEVTVRQVLDKAASNLRGRFDDEPQVESALRMTIGASYAKIGDYASALEHVDRALELRTADPETSDKQRFETMFTTAWVWRGLGRTEEAIDLYSDALEGLSASTTPDYSALLTAENDLALALVEAGRLVEAREHFEKAVELGRTQLGDDALQTLVSESNLARHDADQGRLEAAIARFEAVLPRQRAAIGERHPNTLDTLGNLSTALTSAGRFDEAERLGREALQASREVYGPDHPSTGQAAGNLGVTLYSLGRLVQAEEQLLEAERIHARIYPEEHRDLLRARSNLACVRLDLGRLDESRELAERVLAAQRRVLGESHPHTLTTLNCVASSYKALGRLDDAERVFREALPLYRETHGPEHPQTIVVLENLGGVLFTKQLYEASEILTREALELRRRTLGPDHPGVAKSTFNLGMVVRAKGDLAAARELFEQALACGGERPLEQNPVAYAALQMLGNLDFAAGQHAEAEAQFARAIELARKLGPDGEQVAYLLHQRCAALRGLERNEEALEAIEEALALRERILGPSSETTRVSVVMNADTLAKLGRFEDAERLALELHRACEADAATSASFRTSVRALLERIYERWNRPEEAARWR